MKRYKIETGLDSKGLLKVSFVDEPAIQSTLLYFSEEKINFIFQDEEKKIIYAPALIPDLDIFRKNINGEQGTVFFDKETILKLHMDGCRNGYDQNINLNHDTESNLEGVFCFENWIIEDAVQDKSFKLGFDLPIGTLMKGYKIDNENVWNDIKEGKITGLSIEALLMPVENETVNLKKENMNKKTIIEKIVALFADEKTEYASGIFGNSLENGAVVSDAEGNPVADKEFEFEGKKYKTDAEGKVSEVEEMEAEPMVEEAPVEDDKDAKILELETKIADLEAQLTQEKATKMSKENDLEAQVLKLETELIDAKKIKANPVQVELSYDKMTNAQKVKFNRNN
jgi:hypothetical protein